MRNSGQAALAEGTVRTYGKPDNKPFALKDRLSSKKQRTRRCSSSSVRI